MGAGSGGLSFSGQVADCGAVIGRWAFGGLVVDLRNWGVCIIQQVFYVVQMMRAAAAPRQQLQQWLPPLHQP